MRKAAFVVVALLTVVALYRFCFIPWQANKASKVLEVATLQALSGVPAATAFLREGDGLAVAEAYRARVPDDANLNISVATAYAIAGRTEDALRVYEEALRYDRRPEMYFNRAGLRLRMNDVPGALEDFVYAARFNPLLVHDIRTEAVRSRVEAELERIRTEAK